jgi:hypothetical protein
MSAGRSPVERRAVRGGDAPHAAASTAPHDPATVCAT